MRLILAAAITALAVVLLFWWWSSRQQSFCEVARDQIERSVAAMDDPNSPGYAYYQEHPAERDTLIRTNRDFLNRLPC